MKRILILSTTLLLLGGVFAFIDITTWKVAKNHSIKISGKGIEGIFKKFDAVILFDEANLGASKFNITIDVASLNTGNPLQNRHATGDDWFDAAKYPKIKFTSTAIEKTATGYIAKGKMEVKGKVKEMNIPFAYTKSGNKGKFAANFQIKRLDFGVGKPDPEVAEVIQVNVDVPVTK